MIVLPSPRTAASFPASFRSPARPGDAIFPPMTPQFRNLVFALLLLAQLSGCALLRGHKSAKRAAPAAPAAPPAPLLVGTITLVNDEQHFVLIDSTNSPSPLPDLALKTRGSSGETGELKAGVIRRRPFAIADVVKGTPQVGDQVFQQPP